MQPHPSRRSPQAYKLSTRTGQPHTSIRVGSSCSMSPTAISTWCPWWPASPPNWAHRSATSSCLAVRTRCVSQGSRSWPSRHVAAPLTPTQPMGGTCRSLVQFSGPTSGVAIRICGTTASKQPVRGHDDGAVLAWWQKRAVAQRCRPQSKTAERADPANRTRVQTCGPTRQPVSTQETLHRLPRQELGLAPPDYTSPRGS